MKTPRQIVFERAEEYAKKNLKKISVDMGRYDGSQRCQHIARQSLEAGEAKFLIITLSFVPKSGVNVHFITSNGAKAVDNTLGYLSKRNTYYVLYEYTLDGLKDMDMSKLLNETKEKMLAKLFTKSELKKHKIELTHI